MRPPRKRRRASSDSIVPQADQQFNGSSWGGKEFDVWEAFREEYVEFIEQLPLSLHRNFALLNEIDTQSHGMKSVLSPNIREYIRRRRIVQESGDTLSGCSVQDTLSPLPCGTCSPAVIPQAFPSVDTGGRKVDQQRLGPRRTDMLLSDISVNINQLLYAMEEMMNLAQAAYDSIDRHVRLLDQAIREQEVRSKSDPSPARNILRPLPSTALRITRPKDSAGSLGNLPRSSTQQRAEKNASTYVTSRSGRVPRAQSLSTVNLVSTSGNELNSTRQSTRLMKSDVAVNATEHATARPIRITTDAGSAIVLSAGDMPIDPNEPRYCYCGQVSWGEMIACDATDCEREWFHLGCVGLAEAPKKSKWFCDVCKENNPSGARRRGQ